VRRYVLAMIVTCSFLLTFLYSEDS
jgi:hypothetical protein